MLKYRILAILIGIGSMSFAQNEADVQRYSSNYLLGTARFNSMGGAFGALGGDMSAIHINPAASGVYRFGEISFTPSLEINQITATADGNSFEESVVKPVVNNIGFVLANELKNPKWKSLNFSVTYNRLNTFNDNLRLENRLIAIDGLIGDFLFSADGFAPSELSDFFEGLAYDAFLIDTVGTVTDYETAVALDEEMDLRQTSERSGRMSETALSLSANYDDKLYLGFSVGFRDVVYEQVVETTESTLPTSDSPLSSYTLTEILESEGVGINAKFGAIYRVNDILRVGASIETPTVISLTDNFSSEIEATYTEPPVSQGALFYESVSDQGFFEYRIRTPWRFMLSAAGVIGKKAILSAQYERSNFSSGELRNATSGSGVDFADVNQSINQFFSEQDIIRIGGEYRFNKSLSARAGFAYFSNPIPTNENQTDEDLYRLQYSLGLGYRKAAWFVDAAYTLAESSELYNYTAINTGILQNSFASFLVTVGIRM